MTSNAGVAFAITKVATSKKPMTMKQVRALVKAMVLSDSDTLGPPPAWTIEGAYSWDQEAVGAAVRQWVATSQVVFVQGPRANKSRRRRAADQDMAMISCDPEKIVCDEGESTRLIIFAEYHYQRKQSQQQQKAGVVTLELRLHGATFQCDPRFMQYSQVMAAQGDEPGVWLGERRYFTSSTIYELYMIDVQPFIVRADQEEEEEEDVDEEEYQESVGDDEDENDESDQERDERSATSLPRRTVIAGCWARTFCAQGRYQSIYVPAYPLDGCRSESPFEFFGVGTELYALSSALGKELQTINAASFYARVRTWLVWRKRLALDQDVRCLSNMADDELLSAARHLPATDSAQHGIEDAMQKFIIALSIALLPVHTAERNRLVEAESAMFLLQLRRACGLRLQSGDRAYITAVRRRLRLDTDERYSELTIRQAIEKCALTTYCGTLSAWCESLSSWAEKWSSDMTRLRERLQCVMALVNFYS